MTRSRILLLFPLILLGWFFLHKSPQSIFFPPFEEAQIQNYYSLQDIAFFSQRFHKKKWRLLNRLYKTHLFGRVKRQKNERIPKIIHQIWLGSPFPEKYKKMQQSWIDKHPDWGYYLWTDETVAHLYLKNRTLFEAATNMGQKTAILRYEILHQFGGLYVDCDFECLQAFDIFNENCDFFAGVIDHIRRPEISNALIGAAPNHPILRKCIEELRVQQETGPTFFTKCFFAVAKKKSPQVNIVLPATFFYPIPSHQRDNTFAIYTQTK